MMTLLLTGLVFGLLLIPHPSGVASEVTRPEAPAQEAKNTEPIPWVHLALTRVYGRSPFRECSVNLAVRDSRSWAELRCEFNAQFASGLNNEPPITVRIDLTADEAREAESLFARALLFDGRHVATDPITQQDGNVETLSAQSLSTKALLYVTGNFSFRDDPARHDLLALIGAFEQRLWNLAPKPWGSGQRSR
jgi:hypothetical protein